MKKLLADYLGLNNEEQIKSYDFEHKSDCDDIYYVEFETNEGLSWDIYVNLGKLLVFIYNKK